MTIDLDLDDLREGLRTGAILVVDVREPHELEGGMIPGSVAAPLSTFDPRRLPEPDGRRIVFSCAAGIRSRTAVEICRRAGSPHREHYRGGFHEWRLSGEPIAYPDE